MEIKLKSQPTPAQSTLYVPSRTNYQLVKHYVHAAHYYSVTKPHSNFKLSTAYH